MTIKVFMARTEEEREKVYRFRYRIYVEEHGLHPPEADHARKRLCDSHDPFSVAYGLIDESGNVLGSLRCIYMTAVPDPAPFIAKFRMEPAIRAFGLPALGTTSRFMLDPKLRQRLAVLPLMKAAYDDGRAGGIRVNYGDCSPHMLPFYESMGYRRYIAPYNDTAYGFKLPILMLIGDRQHFHAVRSPLARVADAYADDPEARAWFAAAYPDSLQPRSAALMPRGTFLDLLAERMASDPRHAIGLFRGLSRDEVDRLLSSATLVSANPGDRIVREGERDDTIYVLLKGLAEVVRGRPDGRAIKSFGAGDMFGEIDFLIAAPRLASVVARTPCEVLVLSGRSLRRFLEDEPPAAARLLLNLSRILAARLAQATLDMTPDVDNPVHLLPAG